MDYQGGNQAYEGKKILLGYYRTKFESQAR